jgi:hypothetical protein
MANLPVPAPLNEADYEAIEGAVMETARGRWFLDEYATRLRMAETSGLRDSMKRLELAIASNHDEVMGKLAAALAEEPAEDAAPQPRGVREDLSLAPRHMRYFRADEDVFEPAPEAAIAAVPRLLDMLPPEPEAPPPRHRITIIRRKPGENFEVPLADEMPRAS